jgi:hypothetical protein
MMNQRANCVIRESISAIARAPAAIALTPHVEKDLTQQILGSRLVVDETTQPRF